MHRTLIGERSVQVSEREKERLKITNYKTKTLLSKLEIAFEEISNTDLGGIVNDVFIIVQ